MKQPTETEGRWYQEGYDKAKREEAEEALNQAGLLYNQTLIAEKRVGELLDKVRATYQKAADEVARLAIEAKRQEMKEE